MKLAEILTPEIELNEILISRLKSDLDGGIKSRSKGVKTKLIRKDVKNARWIFNATSGNDTYTVSIAAVKPVTAPKRLSRTSVKVSCTCPAFLWWGSDYTAKNRNYLDKRRPTYPKSRAKGHAPDVRDPDRDNLVCKHILKAYNEWKDAPFPDKA